MGFQESMMNFQWRSKGFWAVLVELRSIPEGLRSILRSSSVWSFAMISGA